MKIKCLAIYELKSISSFSSIHLNLSSNDACYRDITAHQTSQTIDGQNGCRPSFCMAPHTYHIASPLLSAGIIVPTPSWQVWRTSLLGVVSGAAVSFSFPLFSFLSSCSLVFEPGLKRLDFDNYFAEHTPPILLSEVVSSVLGVSARSSRR